MLGDEIKQNVSVLDVLFSASDIKDRTKKLGTAKMDKERAIELFQEYAGELNKSFYSEEEVARADERCLEIIRILAKANFYMSISITVEEQTVHYRIVLYTSSASEGIRQVDYAEATSKFYYDSPRLKPDEMVKELLSSLSGDAAAKYAYRNSPTKEWKFTDKECHVFERALTAHRDALERYLWQQNLPSPEYDHYALMLSHACKLAPTGIDIIIFDFLFEREKAHLEERDGEFELECGCEAREHLEILKEWQRRNVQ